MKIYAVFGIEFHGCRTLIGVYDSEEIAMSKRNEITQTVFGFDDAIIIEAELNEEV
jgi:hypothetical protein